MTLFRAVHVWAGKKELPSLKSVTYLIMIKLSTVIPYLKKIQKGHKSRDTALGLC